jgi:hypothetical protein
LTKLPRGAKPRSPPASRLPGSCDSCFATWAKLDGSLRTAAAIASAFLRASSRLRIFGP